MIKSCKYWLYVAGLAFVLVWTAATVVQWAADFYFKALKSRKFEKLKDLSE